MGARGARGQCCPCWGLDMPPNLGVRMLPVRGDQVVLGILDSMLLGVSGRPPIILRNIKRTKPIIISGVGC